MSFSNFQSLILNLIIKKKIRKITIIKKEPIIKQEMFSNNIKSENKSENHNETVYSKQMREGYHSPSLDILDNERSFEHKKKNQSNTIERSELLEKVFAEFKIEITVINVKLGPVVTLYEILPAAGIKVNTIINLAGDISRSMGVCCENISNIWYSIFRS